jgi:hypothetical protein
MGKFRELCEAINGLSWQDHSRSGAKRISSLGLLTYLQQPATGQPPEPAKFSSQSCFLDKVYLNIHT